MSTNDQPRKPGRKPKVTLSETTEHEMIDVYAHTDRPITEIGRMFGVRDTLIYKVLDKHQIKWRRDFGQSFDEWYALNQIETLPQAVERLDDKLEHLAQHASDDDKRRLETAVVDFLQPGDGELEEWFITITEKFPVMARSIEGALDAGRKTRPHGRITSVRLANS